ncbi:MAG TPA: ATP:cob(I)alamin adenosyltransferase, partial [Oligoflexia bacterium]|nr:ATP:cob(I)alamin adenosyltransferase [Oligoflexia bacterium]
MSFRINRVYTRSGDSGMTKLAGGTAVKKSHPLIGASGDVDELNSLLGLAKEETGGPCRELIPIIAVLQQEL